MLVGKGRDLTVACQTFNSDVFRMLVKHGLDRGPNVSLATQTMFGFASLTKSSLIEL